MAANNICEVCQVCGKVFKNMEGLETHFMSTRLPGHDIDLLSASRKLKSVDKIGMGSRASESESRKGGDCHEEPLAGSEREKSAASGRGKRKIAPTSGSQKLSACAEQTSAATPPGTGLETATDENDAKGRKFLHPQYELPAMERRCPTCRVRFATDEALLRHEEAGRHAGGDDGQGVYGCVEPECSLTFGSTGRLLHHMKIGGDGACSLLVCSS